MRPMSQKKIVKFLRLFPDAWHLFVVYNTLQKEVWEVDMALCVEFTVSGPMFKAEIRWEVM